MSVKFVTKLSNQFLNQFKNVSKYNRILVTGAMGQIGSELITNVNEIQGVNNVLCTDVVNPTELPFSNKYKVLDITNKQKVDELIKEFKPDLIIHNAAILSAMGEKNQKLALDVNVNGFRNILDACTEVGSALFMPSSIASYGPNTPKVMTKELSLQNPRSIYGCTKVFNELVGSYYHYKFGLDFRSVRYPIVISSGTSVHGSAVYCVHVYFGAVKDRKYECYIKEDQRLPFIYITDLISGTLQLIYADQKKLSLQTYNMSSCSFTPKEVAESIKKVYPDFQISYKIDNLRQNVVQTWPNSVDDSLARKEWGYNSQFDLDAITLDMIDKVKTKLNL